MLLLIEHGQPSTTQQQFVQFLCIDLLWECLQEIQLVEVLNLLTIDHKFAYRGDTILPINTIVSLPPLSSSRSKSLGNHASSMPRE